MSQSKVTTTMKRRLELTSEGISKVKVKAVGAYLAGVLMISWETKEKGPYFVFVKHAVSETGVLIGVCFHEKGFRIHQLKPPVFIDIYRLARREKT